MFYIKGSATRGAEVIAALEAKGGKNTHNFQGIDESAFYFTCEDGKIRDIFASEAVKFIFGNTMTELTLPEPEWKPTRGERVLVKAYKDDLWDEAIFSFYDNNKRTDFPYHVIGGVMFKYCIPFDIEKLGKRE